MSRRELIRSGGAVLALPFLNAMVPVFARGAAPEPPRRMLLVNLSLGLYAPDLFPVKSGADYETTPYLKHFEHLRDRFTVISGISHPEVGGLHASEMSFLTAAPHPGTPGYKNTISIDQIVAEDVGAATRYASLSLSSSNGSLSWSRNGVRIPSESNPAMLFRRLFVNGGPGEVVAMERRLREGHSVLDSVRGETTALMRSVGAGDRERMDQYLTAVRDVEKRLHIEDAWSKKPKPQVALKVTIAPDPNDIIARADMMLTLVHLAFETDSTRVATLSIDPDSGVPPIEGIKETRHNLSHHGQDPGKLEQLRKVEHAELASVRSVVDRLAASQDAGGSLLDRTMVFVGSNLGNASNHDTRNLPALLFGGGFKHGQHVAFDPKANVPLANLYLSMLQRYGLQAKTFGTSTGMLRGLEMI